MRGTRAARDRRSDSSQNERDEKKTNRFRKYPIASTSPKAPSRVRVPRLDEECADAANGHNG